MNKALITKGRFLITLLSFLVVMMINATVFGQTTITSKFDGSWSTASNWNPSSSAPIAGGYVRAGNSLIIDQNIATGSGNFLFGFKGTVGSGTISSTISSSTVTGTGTSFLTDFSPNQYLQTSTGAVIGQIASIQSNTSLTLKDLNPSNLVYARLTLPNSQYLNNQYSGNNVTDALVAQLILLPCQTIIMMHLRIRWLLNQALQPLKVLPTLKTQTYMLNQAQL